MPLTKSNLLQVIEITRYCRHLRRIDPSVSVETAARTWIGRYAGLWRIRMERRTGVRA